MKTFSKISLAAATALALSACGGGSDGGSSAGDPADVPLSAAPALVQQYASLLNAARAQARTCGSTPAPAVGPLTTWNPKLQQAAQKHADDMAANKFFGHTGSDNSDANSRAVSAGYNSMTSEILANGYSNANATVSAWLNSPSHCLAIMIADNRTVAAAQSGKYIAVEFGL